MDCGATKPVIGELTWHRWLQALRHLGREADVQYKSAERAFRYGNGECLTAKYEVTIPVDVLGHRKSLTMSVVPGDAPLLIARSCFEEWGFIVNFRTKEAMLADSPDRGWTPLEQSGKGHLLLELIPKATFDEAFAFEDADQAAWDIETADSEDSTEESASGSDSDEGVDAYLTESRFESPVYNVGEAAEAGMKLSKRQRDTLMDAAAERGGKSSEPSCEGRA